MSSDQTPTTPPPDSQTSAPKKARNPVERAVVWLLILGMIAVCAWEALARFGYENSLNNLQAALAADEDGQTLMVDKVPDHLTGSPTREEDEANRIISYHWAGLFKPYGTIHLQYSPDNEILGLLTADAPPPEPLVVPGADDAEGDMQHAAGAPGMAGGPGGPGGGGRGFNPMRFDADGDGKVSREEAPDWITERFAEIDTNEDSYADEEEFAAFGAAMQAGREAGEDSEADSEFAEAESDDAGSDATEDAPVTEQSEPPAGDDTESPEDDN